MIRFYTLNAYYMRHIAYMIFKNCCTHLKDRTLYCLIAVETTGRVAVLHVPKYEVKYLQNHANWNFPQTKFSNMKLKLPRLIRLKFLSKFFTNWKFGFLQSFFNLKFQQLWLFSNLFKINFHASIWHFSNYSTTACSNNHFLQETQKFRKFRNSGS